MSTQTPAVVRDYLARVRTALADLPPAEVDEILEDVRPHLLEIGAELGEEGTIAAMTERLGSPESYAAELRAAGDYPAPEQAGGSKISSDLGSRLALWSLAAMIVILVPYGVVTAGSLSAEAMALLVPAAAVLAAGGWYLARQGDGALSRLPELKPLRTAMGRESKALAYLKSLRPAWWLLCAAVLVVFGLLLFLDEGREGMLALAGLVVIAVVTVWFGPKSVTDRKWLWLSLPVSALVVGVVLGLATEGLFRAATRGYGGYGGSYQQASITSGGLPVLSYGNSQVENIYAFDAQGKPLTEVYLFDQDGKPLTLPRYGCEPGTGTRQREGADNQYPRPEVDQYGYDDQGGYNGYNAYRPGCRLVPGVPFTAAIPKVPVPPPGVPSPTPSAPQPTPTPPPTPSAPATAPTPTG
ncbi:DUF1700 domain-containing protein [Amycolatopsis sp. YIM 10]|uniref:DUF1700 domain-containing protein n=1 Tax=Amycolatopsis sp. YIM 10 TaxID=2653857 RepID=UPI0012906D94|nr:hypothetical protein [Amycolatopsis sp. YIM 10]QFU87412.1 hypothetical protein YIM_11050 [Amycolatopsis sp. YIM 10]